MHARFKCLPLFSMVCIFHYSLHVFSTLRFIIHFNCLPSLLRCAHYTTEGHPVSYHRMSPMNELLEHSPFICKHSNPSRDTNILLWSLYLPINRMLCIASHNSYVEDTIWTPTCLWINSYPLWFHPRLGLDYCLWIRDFQQLRSSTTCITAIFIKQPRFGLKPKLFIEAHLCVHCTFVTYSLRTQFTLGPYNRGTFSWNFSWTLSQTLALFAKTHIPHARLKCIHSFLGYAF